MTIKQVRKLQSANCSYHRSYLQIDCCTQNSISSKLHFYLAAGEDELSFDPDDIIENIEKVRVPTTLTGKLVVH